MRRPWLHHGFWNTLEQAVTRVADALTSFVLIWLLQPEMFSELAVAQAWAAPTFFLFLTPEGCLYRDLAAWKREGPDHVAASLRALRLFAWSKVAVAVVASMLVAGLVPGRAGFPARFAAVLWAYSLVLGPQVGGPDREFIRMELRLRTLNFLTVLQKSILLGGTILVTALAGGRFAPLAAVGWLAGVACALLGWRISSAVLRSQGATEEGLRGRRGPRPRETLTRTLLTFTIWQHLSTTATNWVRTMDIFFLGLFRLPARELGLYGAALKVANLTTAVPAAAVSLFSIWLGRRDPRGRAEERRIVLRMTLPLAAGTILIAIAIALLLPFVLGLLSHGRWIPAEIDTMRGWIHWLLGAGVLYSTALLLLAWQGLRTSYARLFFEVHVPWTVTGLVLFGIAAGFGGPAWAARAAVAVGGACLLLALLRFWRVR